MSSSLSAAYINAITRYLGLTPGINVSTTVSRKGKQRSRREFRGDRKRPVIDKSLVRATHGSSGMHITSHVAQADAWQVSYLKAVTRFPEKCAAVRAELEPKVNAFGYSAFAPYSDMAVMCDA